MTSPADSSAALAPAPPTSVPARRRPLRRRALVPGAVLTAVVLFAAVPLYWLITGSFKSTSELSTIPVTLWPRDWTLDQYAKVFGPGGFSEAIVTSLTIALITTTVVVLFGSSAAYAVTHLKFRQRGPMLSLSLLTQLLPHAAVLIPVFVIWSALGLINSVPGLVLIYTAFQLPVAVWILTGHFASIPSEVVEAAAVDGAGRLRTLLQVVVPMASSGIAAVAIWCVIGTWGEFLFALVLTSNDVTTVTVALASMIGEHSTDTGAMLAGASVAALPPLLLFFLLQKYFQNGVMGAVKG